jgi:Haem-binding uptake, Tiki superfamily, ChaN/PDZ domain
MPIFQFARLNHIPMIALNVDRKLVSQVGQKGWAAVPVSEREGLTDPAPASAAYQRELARIYAMKKMLPPGTDPSSIPAGTPAPEPDEAALTAAMKEPEFIRFVEAQLTWDRAMAEALAGARRKSPNATIVGVLGSGHVVDGHGVPYQLKALGETTLMSLIPETADDACKLVGTSHSDAVFTLPRSVETAAPDRPRLGVFLAPGEDAPRISRVAAASVAEAAGIQAGDHVVRAAGLQTRSPEELVEIVSRQAPGTWLPLSIRRDGQEIDLIAKFPPRATPDR